MLIEAGVCKQGEIWEIRNSLYGLQEAPINWALFFRDEEMARFLWEDNGVGWRLLRTQEPNLWKVVLEAPEKVNMPDKVYAFVAVYVDDILATGEDAVARSTIRRFQDQWKCSPPEWLSQEHTLKFCGFEVSQDPQRVRLHQSAYLKDLLARYPDLKTASSPLPGCLDDSDEPDPDIQEVRRAQTLVEELLWLAVCTRVDISYAVSWLGRHVARCPARAQKYGAQVLGFLQGAPDHGLLYTHHVKGEHDLAEEKGSIHM